MDKRTKEYKEWKAKHDSSPDGLGDTVETITKNTGIKKAVKKVFGDDCGCDERRKKLNHLFSYKPKGCFTESQYNAWTAFRNRKNKNIITTEEQQLISDLLKDIYHMSIQPNCASCSASFYKKWIGMLDKFYEQY